MSRSEANLTGRLAAYSAMVVPAMLLAPEASAGIYSQTGLSLRIGSGGTDTTLTITGAGNASVGQINLSAQGWGVAIHAGGFAWKEIYQRATHQGYGLTANHSWYGLSSRWYGGLPVEAGATWNNLGRTANELPGTQNVIRTGGTGAVCFGYYNTTSSPFGFARDPQGVGNTGKTWYLMFKFDDGTGGDHYGWLSFDANVVMNGVGSYITVTGWGWDDSGNTIAAGATAGPAVPGVSGLAALAIGAAGIRGRRRSVA